MQKPRCPVLAVSYIPSLIGVAACCGKILNGYNFKVSDLPDIHKARKSELSQDMHIAFVRVHKNDDDSQRVEIVCLDCCREELTQQTQILNDWERCYS